VTLALDLAQVALLGLTAWVAQKHWVHACVWFADRGEPVERRPW
jgi:hypothetical protein